MGRVKEYSLCEGFLVVFAQTFIVTSMFIALIIGIMHDHNKLFQQCESTKTECEITRFVMPPDNYMRIRNNYQLKNTPSNVRNEIYWIVSPKTGKDGNLTDDTYLLTERELYFHKFDLNDEETNITCYWCRGCDSPVGGC